MDTHIVGDEIDTVSSQHVEGGVCDVYNAGYTKDQGKPNGEESEYTSTNETTDDDIQNKTHISSLLRR
jgi:hypothetical protein